MKNKRIVMKEGFLVDEREVRTCHFSEVRTVDMWGTESTSFLVLIDGNISIVDGHKNEVFINLHDANNIAEKRRQKHLEFCRKQVDYYQRQIDGDPQ